MDGCCHSNPDTDPDAHHNAKRDSDQYERGYHDGYRDGYANATSDCLSHAHSDALLRMETRLHMPSPESELSDDRLEHGVDASINDCWSHRRSG